MSLSRFPDLLARIEDGTAAEEVASLERLAAAAPGHAAAHVALARVYELKDRREDAHRSWQRAHVLLPSSPAVRAGLWRTARHQKAGAEAPAAAPSGLPATAEPSIAAEDPASARTRPAGAVERQPASFENLDDLIQDLESARIEPNPDPADVPTPNLEDDVDDMVSPTLARIYERQGQHADAARIYRRLADERPGDADAYRRKAEEMEQQAEMDEGANSDEDADR